MEIFKASNQWATRPADERFWTLQEMSAACHEYKRQARASTVRYGDLRVTADGTELLLIGKQNVPARLTHFAMGQISARVQAPPSYLRKLPPTLAAQNLNYGLAHQKDPDDSARLLVHANGGYLVRCFTGTNYQRIWNAEIADRLIPLLGQGWKTPPARPANNGGPTRVATAEDICGNSLIKVGDMIGPAGIYASDRDMFVFMVTSDENGLYNPADPNTPLNRGFFIWNSEVGDKSFGIMTFLFDKVCGNHIVWDAKEVKEFRIRHIGAARNRAFARLSVDLRQYADASASEAEGKIVASQTYEIAAKKDDVIDALMRYIGKRRLTALNKGLIEEAYEVTSKNARFGSPKSPWGIAQGLTQVSQESSHTSRRVAIDSAASKILEMAF